MAEYNEAQQKLREEIEQRRFYTINQSGETDTYVRAYITMKTIYDSGISRFNRKSREKEIRKMMDEFDITGYAKRPEEEQQVIYDQWVDFACKYVKFSLKDKSYSRQLFGIFAMKEESVERKLLADFTEVSEKLPEFFELTEEFAPLNKALMEGYEKSTSHE